MQSKNLFANQFLIVETSDGSPTLRLNTQDSEAMHHSAGAASETVYIYGAALSLARDLFKTDQIRHMVIGLGLGYIEILIALMTHFQFQTIDSFEVEEKLVTQFKNWIFKEESLIHDQVIAKLSKFSNVRYEKNFFISQFQEKINSNIFKIHQQINMNSVDKKFQIIHYDAFSSTTDQTLWSEEWLSRFINKYCDQHCVFVTYAKTGILNRVLKKAGFKMIKKAGFAGKRESTLAYR